MLNIIKFRLSQYKIEQSIDRISRAHDKAVKEARSKGATSEQLYELGLDYQFERVCAEDKMIGLTHSYYVRLANRMLIPVPTFEAEGGAWMQSQQTGRYHLKPQELHELRTAVRAEQKARREVWAMGLVLVTGVIGALSGLIAIIKN